MKPLTSKQRAYLRGLANGIPAIMQVGKDGLTANLLSTVSDALEARELIKLHVLENSGCTAREIADRMSEELSAGVVGVIGRMVILYRPSVKKPVIELPVRA